MKQLLFVDDEPSFLESLKRMLHRHRGEWHISTATGVDKALQAIKAESFKS